MRSGGAREARTLILQRVVPHYRVPLFEALHARAGVRVLTAAAPPGNTFLNLGELSKHPWAELIPIRFPNPEDAFRAEVPLDAILERYRPTNLVAEFGLKMSSTWQLAGARRRGRLQRYAFWTHGWQMERGFTSPPDILAQGLRVVKLREADALGSYSEEGATWLRAKAPKVPVVALGNALDDGVMKRAAAATTARRNGSPQLIALGRLSSDKRFDALIEIFRDIRRTYPGAALTVIGDGPEMGRLKSLAGEDLDQGVTFPGAIYGEMELAPYFTGADLLVIPGAAGLTVNHGLAYGLPIVAFARGPGSPRHHPEIEYVVDGESGLLVREPSDAAMAARIVGAIASGEHLRVREALKVRSPAPSIAKVADQFEALLEILERPVRTPPRGGVSNRGPQAGQREGSGMTTGRNPTAFLWENFGPMHEDRLAAVARRCGSPDSVLGIEITEKNVTYDWRPGSAAGFRKATLFPSRGTLPAWRIAVAIVRTCRRAGVRDAFFCHYERPEIFMAALAMRLMGHRVFLMNDSKFDDYPRHLWRELAKSVSHMPYSGGIAAGSRSKDYMRFLGHRPGGLHTGYDAISVDKMKALVADQRDPPFNDRDFLVVARLVPKKNVATAIVAFAMFAEADRFGRRLHICGSGPLDADLKRQVVESGLVERVVFHGFEQVEVVARRMKAALALILPSTEEQFGLVIAEAMAVGLPVIVSPNCGACDSLVRSGVNGFVAESDNPTGMAFFMSLLSGQEALWSRLSKAAIDHASKVDVEEFVRSVAGLINIDSQPINVSA